MGQQHSKRASSASTEPLTRTTPEPNDISKPVPPTRIHHLSELIDLNELFPGRNSFTPTRTPASDFPRLRTRATKYTSPSQTATHSPASQADAYTGYTATTFPTPRPLPLARTRTIVQSPSGQELDAFQYMSRPDRPLTVAERQARITERMEMESRAEGERRREFLRVMRAREEVERRKRRKERGCSGWCW